MLQRQSQLPGMGMECQWPEMGVMDQQLPEMGAQPPEIGMDRREESGVGSAKIVGGVAAAGKERQMLQPKRSTGRRRTGIRRRRRRRMGSMIQMKVLTLLQSV